MGFIGMHSWGALALWQADSISSGNSKLLMIFIGIAALALSAQAVAFILMAVGATKFQKKVGGLLEEIHKKTIPVLDQSNFLLTDLTPKIKDVAENVHHISFVVRDKVNEFDPTISAANVTLREANATAQEANAKAREQITRVNGMVTSALNATAELAGTIHHSIRGPVREVAGLVSGVTAGLNTLIGRMANIKDGFAAARATPVKHVPKGLPTDMRDVEFAPVVADRRDIGL